MSDEYLMRSRKVFAKQVASDSTMIAEKDREEQNRLVAQWIVNNGGEVTDFSTDSIGFQSGDGVTYTEPSGWVVTQDELKPPFYFMDNVRFTSTYEPSEVTDDLV